MNIYPFKLSSFLKKNILILFSLFCISIFSHAQKPDLRFKTINVNQGLSNSSISQVIQDRSGFMWFSTLEGLNKYDGNSVKIYKHNPKDSNSISSNLVTVICEDSNGNLWLGTDNGLNLYNRELDNFLHLSDTKDFNIGNIYEDKRGTLWLFNRENIYVLERNSNSFRQFKSTVEGNNVCYFYEDRRGNLWANDGISVYIINRDTEKIEKQHHIDVKAPEKFWEDTNENFWIVSLSDGIVLYDRDNRSQIKFKHEENNPNSPSNNSIQSIAEDSKGRLWLGTINGGLNIFDTEKKVFYHYNNDPGDIYSISANSVTTIYKDNSGIMWLGTFNGGINYVQERRFTHKYSILANKNSLSHNVVTSFAEDNDGNIWIGTDGGGLNFYDRKTEKFTHYRHNPKDPNSISSDVVTSIIKDIEGNLWISFWMGGISKYDFNTRTFKNFQLTDETSSDLQWSSNCFMYLYQDNNFNIWAAALNQLYLFDKENSEFQKYVNPRGGLTNYVCSILQDKNENLWIGSWNGLHLLDVQKNNFTSYQKNQEDSTSLSANKIFVLFEDTRGRFWIGTDGGLNLFDKNSSFQVLNNEIDIPGESIYGIVEDDEGILWLSTSNGICRFNPDDKTTKNFNLDDGLQGNDFKEHAYLKLSSGEILFGGANGFNLFNPKNLALNTKVPSVILTDFKIFNAPVPIGKNDSPLKSHISLLKELVLSYKDAVFSFEFAALDYFAPEKNQYAYKMDGFETQWNYIGNKRSATYTNLDPGKYIFRVKASNNDGLWNEEGIAVSITITPPAWQTWWFKTLVFLILIGSVFSVYKARINIIKNQKEELKKQVIERTFEIVAQKEEIKAQSEKLEDLFNEFKDSVRAAQKIQQSILPTQEHIRKHLPRSFILNKPKDVVSGDFCWFDVINDKIIIAVVDCTGHGVSGAFMSINGHHLLNKSVHGNYSLKASDILNRLNSAVIKELHQEDETEVNDGMDLALCIIDIKNKHLQYAGANNPLYLFRNNDLVQIKANKFSLGLSITGKILNFDNNEIKLHEGDTIYIFSDGYADQLGGETQNEKFMYPRFRDLLLSIHKMDMDQQALILDESITRWQGNFEQLDDIMVIGFKI